MDLSSCNPAIGSEVVDNQASRGLGPRFDVRGCCDFEGFRSFYSRMLSAKAHGTVDMWWRYAGRDPLRQVRHLIIEKCSPVPELDLRAYKNANPLL
jgi:hypothetical protein